MSQAKVFIEKSAAKADYKVFFVNYRNQQKNHQIIKDGKLVKQAGQADITVAIVKFKAKANIIIMRKNFPK